jgi:hypothetical protein
MGDPGNLPRLAALTWTGPLAGWAGLAMATYAQRKKVVDAFQPGGGLQLKGSDADRKAYMAMVRREMLRSGTFYNLMLAINADKKNPLEVTLGRNQKGMQIDSFDSGSWKIGAQEVDLADIDKFPIDPPSGHPHAITQGELLIHAMAEAKAGAQTADYPSSHEIGVKAENDYRDDRGQKGHRLAPSKDPEDYKSNNWTIFFDGHHRERWLWDKDGRLLEIEYVVP